MQLYLTYRYIRICVSIRHIFCESLVKLCLTKLKCRSFLWNFFKQGTVFPAWPIKLYWKSKIQPRWDDFERNTVFLVNIPSLCISWCKLQTRYRQTDFFFIYGPFGSRTLLSGSHKNRGHIGLIKSKLKHLFRKFKTVPHL